MSVPLDTSRITLAFNDGLGSLRFCLMSAPPDSVFIIGAEPALNNLSKFRGPR